MPEPAARARPAVSLHEAALVPQPAERDPFTGRGLPPPPTFDESPNAFRAQRPAWVVPAAAAAVAFVLGGALVWILRDSSTETPSATTPPPAPIESPRPAVVAPPQAPAAVVDASVASSSSPPPRSGPTKTRKIAPRVATAPAPARAVKQRATPTRQRAATQEYVPANAQPSREDVMGTLDSARGAISNCAEGAGGDVSVRVVIAGSGRVTSATITGGSVAGTPAASCITRVIRGLGFPGFADSSFTVNYRYRL